MGIRYQKMHFRSMVLHGPAASWATQVELHVVRSRNAIFVQRQ